MNSEFKKTSANEIKDLIAQKELFIFDLDGTLFNSLGDLAPAVNFALKQFGIHEIEKETVRTCIGNGSRNLVRRAIAAGIVADRESAAPLNVRDAEAVATVLENAGYDDAKVDAVLKTYSQYYWEHCTENTIPYKGVLEVLKRIHDAGKNCAVQSQTSKRKIAAMLTNKPELPAKKILEKFGITDKFAMILCGDTTPERKPGPGGIYAILEKVNNKRIAPEKAVMIGDDTPDLMAARNAGIDCITLLEGFGRPENLLPLQPKYTVGHIKDFADFV